MTVDFLSTLIKSRSLLFLTVSAFLLFPAKGIAQERPGGNSANSRTALDDYVAAPDTNYSFRVVNSVPGKGQTTFLLEMTSQSWLTTNEVDRPLWKHWLVIVKPEKVASSKSLLFISGGANDGRQPRGADGNLTRIALETKSIVSELKMVPNQPLVFAGETKGRTEDALIAYT